MLPSTSLHWQHTLWLWRLWARVRPRASVLSTHFLAGFWLSGQIYLHASAFLSLYLSKYVFCALCWCLSCDLYLWITLTSHIRILVMSSASFLVSSGHSNLKVIGFKTLSALSVLICWYLLTTTFFINATVCEHCTRLISKSFTWWCKHEMNNGK